MICWLRHLFAGGVLRGRWFDDESVWESGRRRIRVRCRRCGRLVIDWLL